MLDRGWKLPPEYCISGVPGLEYPESCVSGILNSEDLARPLSLRRDVVLAIGAVSRRRIDGLSCFESRTYCIVVERWGCVELFKLVGTLILAGEDAEVGMPGTFLGS